MRLGLKVPQSGSRPFDVAGFGLNSIDLLAVVAEYPASNSKQRLQRFMHMAGGQIGTALTACAKLGLTTTYVGSFGSDPLGVMSRQSLLDYLNADGGFAVTPNDEVTEQKVRGMLHLAMSLPNHQLA